MFLSDISFTTEGMVVISTLIVALAGVVSVLFKLLISAKDSQLTDMISQRDSYKEISIVAIQNLEDILAGDPNRSSKLKVPALADIVPEHSSPANQKQIDAAALQTIRARLTAVSLQAGIIVKEPQSD